MADDSHLILVHGESLQAQESLLRRQLLEQRHLLADAGRVREDRRRYPSSEP